MTVVLLALTVGSMVWMYRKTRNGTPPNAPARPQAVMGTLTAMACGVLAIDSLLKGMPAGSPSVFVPALGAVLCAPGALRGWRTPAHRREDQDPRTTTVFWLLALTPLFVGALGLPIAIGGLVFAWTFTAGPTNARRAAVTLASASAIGIATHYLLEEVASLLLPRGWLWSLL
jgi:hypothetical protein